MLEPKLPHQWNATMPCREEDGWRKCNLTHDTYKDIYMKKCTRGSRGRMSICLSLYDSDLFKYSPHYYNMTKELPHHTEVCVPRNDNVKLFCNLIQHEDNSWCSNDEIFIEMEPAGGNLWLPSWFR